jgi:murein DD-endopeptidase MepM/ murein hydrolase activator NlpD
LLAVLALPATGFNIENEGWASEQKNADQTAKVTGTDSEAALVALPEYSVTTYADLLKLTYGASRGFSYSVTNSGRIRWPFPVVVPISSGYGGRVAPCLGCSSYHEGLDFNPTEGTPFYAVADGVVTQVTDDAWGLGKWVVIHHETGKLSFDSLYAHMIRDSTGVKVGQEVKVGDYIGRVGNSGTSTGAHLHFEVHVDGTPVDPFEWLKKYAKGK